MPILMEVLGGKKNAGREGPATMGVPANGEGCGRERTSEAPNVREPRARAKKNLPFHPCFSPVLSKTEECFESGTQERKGGRPGDRIILNVELRNVGDG
jgi:hypothetical protein